MQALCEEFPNKDKGYHANATSHAHAWQRVAQLDASPTAAGEVTWALILEDDVCLHHDWRVMLASALATIESGGKCAMGEKEGGAASTPLPVDCFLLDGLFVTGEASAEYGWLGPPQEGPHRAVGVAFSDACKQSILSTRSHAMPVRTWLPMAPSIHGHSSRVPLSRAYRRRPHA